MTVHPDPGVIVIEVVHATADPSATLSEVIRWIGVVVAVAGVALATPDGIASAWRSLRNGLRKMNTLARRLVGRPVQPGGAGHVSLKKMGVAGQGYVDTWMPWSEKARAAEKIEILHQQADELLRRLDGLRTRHDGDVIFLRSEIREAESRSTGQIRQIASEMRGERSQASHVDARGLGPVALGIVLTGIPDELAKIPAIGVTAVAIAVVWTACMVPGWKRDLTQALKENKAEGVLEDGASGRNGVTAAATATAAATGLTAATGDNA
jgi:hypothetical protein